MKNQISKTARLMAVLALACITFLSLASCGGDDEGTGTGTNTPQPRPSEPELSEETTPVKFETGYGDRFFFDYGGGKYLGSDTLTKGWGKTYDLRQGMHHLVWLKDLDKNGFYIDAPEGYGYGTHYDPVKRIVKNLDIYPHVPHIQCAEMDLQVYPTLLPTQQVKYKHITCEIYVHVTDIVPGLAMPVTQPNSISYTEPVIGEVTIPYIYSLSLNDNSTQKDERASKLYTYRPTYDTGENVKVAGGYFVMLCPPDGVQNIQPTAKVRDANGKEVKTTPLPRISVKPGYTTIIEGTLFSGTMSDWKVSYEPYLE